MLKKFYALFALLLVASMLLSACGAPATEAPVAEAPVAEAAAPVEEAPVEAPVVEEPATIDVDAVLAEIWSGVPAETGYASISATKLNEALAEGGIFLVDAREPSEFAEGTIAGAVNLPIRDLLNNLDKLPEPDEKIVIFCKSGHRGALGMTALRALGYTDVINLAGGMGAWSKAELAVEPGVAVENPVLGMPVMENQALFDNLNAYLMGLPEGYGSVSVDALATSLAENPAIILIDVRSAAELESNGYIAGSINIPLPEFLGNAALPADKDAPIVIYCGSGHRGAIAALAMHLMGYSNVKNLAGGFTAWKAGGMDVAGAVDWMSVYGEFLTASIDAKWYQISADALNEAFMATPPFVLDIREPSEIAEKGYIEGSVNIPTKEVFSNLDKLPGLDTPFVVTCASGHRGNIMTIALRLLGYQVTNLSGGFNGWAAAELPVVTGEPAAPVAGTAAEVDATKLAKLQAFIANYPEGWAMIKPADLNVELGNEVKPVVLDVRTVEEYAETGVIEGALLIPLSELASRVAELPADKAAPVVVTCKSGTRATYAMLFLQLNGYTNVRNLTGGVMAWSGAELPLVK